MEDGSVSEAENKGADGRNESIGASPAGFSPTSEVHIISSSCSVCLLSFLSFFHFCALALELFPNALPPPPPPLSDSPGE